MLVRQRAILRLIEKAERPLSSTVLFKLAFLLRQETVVAHDATFYDFLPYKFGPYSFAMQRETETLASYGYLTAQMTAVGATFVPGEVRNESRLPAEIDAAIEATLKQYAGISQRDLLKDVYARYPWYAVNTELRELLTTPLPSRLETALAIYTMGYHRTSIDLFINRLLREGIQNILDVRANPISRKYGFAGSSLHSICCKVGLGYHHFPRLGIPSSQRRGISGEVAFRTLFADYERRILTDNLKDIRVVSSLIKSAPSVLLCAEQDASECHRGRLAVAVANSTGLPIVDF